MVVQQTDYYPFGMPTSLSMGEGVQPYKFGGKEYDTNSGLDLYDFHARQYDPAFIRFTSMDPLAEKYYSISPYVYCANNPLKYIDPTGMYIWKVDLLGNLYAEKGDNAQTLAKIQNISYGEALKQLIGQGYKIDDKGVVDLKVGDKVYSKSLDDKIKNKMIDGAIENIDKSLLSLKKELEELKKEEARIQVEQDAAGANAKPAPGDPSGGLLGAYI